MQGLEILDVIPANLGAAGLFCCMSQPESEMYQQKLLWMKERFSEGLRYRKIVRGGRGFIEYIPGEFAWRGIHAPRYMVIHCLWVVGKSKGRGCGKALLDLCIQEAKREGMDGVAVVAARNQLGLPDTKFFLKHGFTVVDTAPPDLELAALKFRRATGPKFLGEWDKKLHLHGPDLKVVYSAQCPFAKGLVDNLASVAKSQRLALKKQQLRTLAEVRTEAPSAYATFAITCRERVVSHLYHRMTANRLRRLMKT